MNKKEETITSLVTREDILKGLIELGVRPGMILEVHSALSSFGYVPGGAQTVVDALMELVGKEGTLLMPTQAGGNSEPSQWMFPPVDPKLIPTIRKNIPSFDKKGTDTRGMGAIVENFRRREGTIISSHPLLGYAAWGKYAKLLCNHQSLHFGLSEESPTARLYELKGYVLLLGVDITNCTCLHLAEYRADCRPIAVEGTAIDVNGQRVWKKYLNLVLESDDFMPIGHILEEKGLLTKTNIGKCKAQLFRADEAIDEGVKYFEQSIPYDMYR